MQFHRIAIAPNAFKGTLTALQAADRIRRGLTRALPRTTFISIPMADGGDGTTTAIVAATHGRLLSASVHDPLHRKIHARFGLSGTTAIIELSAASGLALLQPRERNPLKTSTFGTGELIRAALRYRPRIILIGIGGSATNDAAIGLAQALGARLLDRRGRELPPGASASNLAQLAHIDLSQLDPRLKRTQLLIACDVNNPLAGPRGAAHIYAPQKGATPAMVRRLDSFLRHFAAIVRADLGLNILHTPGAGAAGGAGGGLLALLGAQLRPGVDLVMEAVQLEKRLADCDLVITGEGRLDAQTAFGKAPAGVARIARSLGIPVIALCGSLAPKLPPGFDAVFSALEEPLTESQLPARAPAMLERTAEHLGRLLALGSLPR